MSRAVDDLDDEIRYYIESRSNPTASDIIVRFDVDPERRDEIERWIDQLDDDQEDVDDDRDDLVSEYLTGEEIAAIEADDTLSVRDVVEHRRQGPASGEGV